MAPGKYLPKNLNTFSTLRLDKRIYVDKTRYIYDVLQQRDRYYFLSRPRRFGKSLLLSTLQELFEGNKDLFEGLYIASTDYEWKYHPVIHLDFSVSLHKDADELEQSLARKIDLIAKRFEIGVNHVPSPQEKIEILVEQLAAKYGRNSVVILVDEYDKPMLDSIGNPTLVDQLQKVLKGFYDAFKGLDKHLHAMFIVGVTKCARTSIFSGLNNLEDISEMSSAAALLGYTEQEIMTYFSSYLSNCSALRKISIEDVILQMKRWYNGYCFSADLISVYNPHSVLKYLSYCKQANYWFSSGTPSFLISLLKTKQPEELQDLESFSIEEATLATTYDVDQYPCEVALYQAGYLTIKDYDSEFQLFRLGIPNEEVLQSMAIISLGLITATETQRVKPQVSDMVRAIQAGDVALFCKHLEALFASIPYNLHIPSEKYYHSMFHFLSQIIGLNLQSEVLTSNGRIDLVIETKSLVYIFEFKMNQSPEKAVKQINDKRYFEKYQASKKELKLIGLSFNVDDKKLACTWLES